MKRSSSLTNKQKKIHFLHIPKTGGTSVSIFLEKQFKKSEICPYIYLKFADEWIPKEHILMSINVDEMKKYNFFTGHTGWVPRTIVPENEIETLTFLRDPVARSLSLYKFITGNISIVSNTHNHWKTVDDFVFDKEFGLELRSNLQTRSFCADLFFQKSTSEEPDNEHIKHSGIFANVEIDLSPKQMLNLAIERLHKCSFVGITEYFNESFQWLCMQYQWLIPENIPKKNMSLGQPLKLLNNKTLERIIELNNLDFILYREAIKIYEDRKKVRIYINNDTIEKTIMKENAIQKEINFTFADKLIGEGWEAREEVLSKVFAWSSATTSTLYFPIQDKHNLRINFRIKQSIITDLQKKITLTANTIPIDLKFQFHPEGGFVFDGIIHKKILLKNKLLKLTFSIPETIRPIDLSKENKDLRQLGFTLDNLKITPINIFKLFFILLLS